MEVLIHVHRAKQESKTKLHGRYIRSVVVLRFHSFRFLNMCDDGLLSGEERERAVSYTHLTLPTRPLV